MNSNQNILSEKFEPKPKDSIKRLNILPDTQPSDDIDEPSSSILTQETLKVSSYSAQLVIDKLANLSELDYELQRIEIAKSLNNMSVRSLDKLVNKARNKTRSDSSRSLIVGTTPYSEPIDGTVIANQIYQILDDHVACTEAVKVATVLWIMFSWVIDASTISPLAWINAPEKRCGKTTLLTLMSRMSKRSLSTSNVTGSALFRSIETYKPTLFIDEIDTFINDNEGIRGILNAGHSRDNSYILRCNGDDNEPIAFNVYGAKAISGIGKIPNTLIDRSITLTLKRKTKSETKSRVRDLAIDITDTIQSKLARWSDDNILEIKTAKPVIPPTINDRAQDNWEILLKVALLLDEEWIERAFKACIEISGIEQDEPSLNEQLLADIREFFLIVNTERLLSRDLLKGLCSDPEMIWSTLNYGKPITPHQIAKRLKGFKISSKDMRTLDLRGKDVRGKGYDINDFEGAFSRYL